MSRKITTYNRASLADQIANGAGTREQAEKLLANMVKDGKSPKTLKRIRQAIDRAYFGHHETFPS